ncbi:MAG: rhodanese-like domain-containing protein [Armatimonadota bacterium]
MSFLFSILLAGAMSLAGGPNMPADTPVMPLAQAAYHKLSPQEAKALLDRDPAITLVDVRTEAEFREQRIAGSLLIPDYELETLAPQLLPDKHATILLYCRSGRRSREAAMKLVAMGYPNVFDFGGIIDWPYATVSGK